MKHIALILAVMISISAQAVTTVIVSNDVCAYQTDAQRRNYTGRAGEQVRNSDNNSITIFDGNQLGGFPVQDPLVVRVWGPEDDSTVAEQAAGDRLRTALGMATNIAANLVINPPSDLKYAIIELGDGIYDVGSSPLVIPANVKLFARRVDPIGEQDQSLSYLRPLSDYAGAMIKSTGTNTCVKTVASGNSTVAHQGIYFDGNVDCTNVIYLGFIDCCFNGDLVGKGDKHLAAQNCRFGGDIFDGCINTGYIKDSYFKSTITYSPPGGYMSIGDKYSTRSTLTIFDSRFAADPAYNLPDGPDSYTMIFKHIRCLFDGDLINDTTNTIIGNSFDYCRFVGTTASSWGFGTGTPKYDWEFNFCTGIDGSASGVSGVTLNYCTDSSNQPIANQYTALTGAR